MDLSVLFSAGIFLVSFLGLLLAGFNAMLKPIKRDIERLESGQAKLESGQAKLEKRMDGIEEKLDGVIDYIKQLPVGPVPSMTQPTLK